MNKPSPMFFIVAGMVIIMAVSAVIAIPGTAGAYSVGSGSASSSYDFNSSFENLVSPFVQFFQNIQLNGGSVSVGTGSGNGSGPASVTVNFNFQQYIDQFDNWFYQTTGVHIEGLTSAIINFFDWLFRIADRIVMWVAGLVGRSIPA